jgi:hypothetical protein
MGSSNYVTADSASKFKPLARIAYGSESEALYRMVRGIAILKPHPFFSRIDKF